MGLKQLIVLTQGPTSSASSQHASCLPTEQSATEPGTGSARWELRDNLWGLIPVQLIWTSALSPYSTGPALAAGLSAPWPLPRLDDLSVEIPRKVARPALAVSARGRSH
jgi:hypothetical protein